MTSRASMIIRSIACAARLSAAVLVVAAALAACSIGGTHDRDAPLVPTADGASVTPAGNADGPALGASWAADQKGYGRVRPRVIDSGGNQAGYVGGITWQDWGSERATGHGTGYWVHPGRAVTEARPADATLVAFDLGECGGQPAYRKLQWYFPAKGQSFARGQGTDICGDDGDAERPIPPTPTTRPTTAPTTTGGTTGATATGPTTGPAALAEPTTATATSSSPVPKPDWLGAGPDPFVGRGLAEDHGLTGGAYYFTSPSGNFSCGIVGSEYGLSAHAGCTGETSPAPDGVCPENGGIAGGMTVDSAGEVTYRCAVGLGYNPAADALPYGSYVRALGFSCASRQSGVYCRDDTSGHGFLIAHGDNGAY